MRRELRLRIEAHFGREIVSLSPLSGGCLSSCVRVDLGEREVVAKFGGQASFVIEARMLEDLRCALERERAEEGCRAPEVYFVEEDLLVMEWIEHKRGREGSNAEVQARGGRALAALHSCRADSFGYEYDTPLGAFVQSNKARSRWHEFYRDQRLLPALEASFEAGHLGEDLRRRVLGLCERQEELLGGRREVVPSLLHGDLWGGNMLWGGGGLAGLIDPALYYGDAEVDLAMLCLFPCVGEAFFEGYRSFSRSSDNECWDEFWRVRRYCYALYPILLHCLFFGTRYCPLLAQNLLEIEHG